MHDLYTALLAPRSVAIVGASADASKTASRPLRYLIEGGFRGNVYPINPRVEEIEGVKCWPDLASLPESPDIAFVLLPPALVARAIEDCGNAGIKIAMVLASGFGESGAEGRAREEELVRVAAAAGVRVLGPSCIGLASLHRDFVLTGNAAFAETSLLPGGVFCASQSGSMIGALLSRGRERGVNFAGLVSVGAEADLSLGELCEATLDDPNIDSYMLFLETIRDATAIRRFAVGAHVRGKPIVALKLGRSKEAAELATSHTGGLSGEDDVADAFLADCGIARVETLDGLLEAMTLTRKVPVRDAAHRQPTVGVVTTTGGGAAMVVDQLGVRGVTVEGPDETTLAAIRATGVDIAAGRIADLTLAGVKYDVMRGAIEAMLASPQYDAVVAVVGSSARFQPELAVKPVVDVGRDHNRLATFIVPEAPEALAMLAAAGVPAFRTPEACADAIAAALRRRPARDIGSEPLKAAPSVILDEMEGYGLLAELGVEHAPAAVLTDTAGAVPEQLLPAVVKILGRDIAHKTELGGVVLGVKTSTELEAAGQKVRASVSACAQALDTSRLLVQKMVAGSVGELLVGYKVDAQVGPMVLVAAGGTMTELIRDRSLRMAPVTLEIAREMLTELKTLPMLTGYRGRQAGDVEAAARAIVAISNLAERGEVQELEVNPLMIMPEGQGALAVDVVARVTLPA